MPDPKSKARVQRLLNGNFRPDDLGGLFLFARDHCDGRELITDVGHFVAHHNERDKGIVTRSTREWVTIARFHMPRFAPGGPHQLNAWSLPAVTPDYFRIAVNRMNAKTIRDKTGLPRAKAYALLRRLSKRLVRNANGTWAFPIDYTPTEVKLVECVSSVLMAAPILDGNMLFDQFVATLKSNGLITKDEIRVHSKKLSILVQLYAVSVMHNAVVIVGDGTTIQLEGNLNMKLNEIHVGAAVPNVISEYPNIAVTTSIFTAYIDPHVHCHPELVTDKKWDFEIELGPDGRLAVLR